MDERANDDDGTPAEPAIPYYLGIDLGTTYTAAAVWRDGRCEVANLGNLAPVVPSVVLLRQDGALLVGEAAERRAATEPERIAREFKRRVGDSVPMIVAGTPYSADALMGRLLRWTAGKVAEAQGGPPAAVVIAHPANWSEFKKDLLRNAIRAADLDGATMLTEPEAAAIHYASQQRVAAGALVAVYDLGGGTFDAAVLRQAEAEGDWAILGRPEGIERLGGTDFDEAVFHHVCDSIGEPVDALDQADPTARAAMARLRRECVAAKEALAADTDTTIPVLLPGHTGEVRLTRTEFEEMIRPALVDSIACLKRALASAGVEADDVSAVLLAGGSSRIPLVAQLVGRELGRPVAVDAHPKHGVALGAAVVAARRAPPVADEGRPRVVAAAVLAPTPEPDAAPEPSVPEPEAPEPEEATSDEPEPVAAPVAVAVPVPVPVLVVEEPVADEATDPDDGDDHDHDDADEPEVAVPWPPGEGEGGPQAGPGPLPVPARRPARRRKALVAAIVLLVLAASGGVVALDLDGRPEPGAASPSASPDDADEGDPATRRTTTTRRRPTTTTSSTTVVERDAADGDEPGGATTATTAADGAEPAGPSTGGGSSGGGQGPGPTAPTTGTTSPPPQLVEVPSVVGYGEQDAVGTLAAYGLNGVPSDVSACAEGYDAIVDWQSPGPGEQVEDGSTVTLGIRCDPRWDATTTDTTAPTTTLEPF